MNNITNILIVGVGGQGVLLASELLSEVAFLSGLDVKKSEVHGMAQRGGVVSSHVRFGEKVDSPLIPEGSGDAMLAFEEAEALRWQHHMKDNSTVIINQQKLMPPIALIEGIPYPGQIFHKIEKRIKTVIGIDANKIAIKIGNIRVVNMVLIGVLSRTLQLNTAVWLKAIEKRVPKGTEEMNLNAFQIGRTGE